MKTRNRLEWSCWWQVSELIEWKILTIWSWSNIANTFEQIVSLQKYKLDIEFEDYFDVISSMDWHTSKEFDVLTLLPDIKIETN